MTITAFDSSTITGYPSKSLRNAPSVNGVNSRAMFFHPSGGFSHVYVRSPSALFFSTDVSSCSVKAAHRSTA